MALPLGRVKEVHEISLPPHHSGAALPAERDVQKRFINGRRLSDSFDGGAETLLRFAN